MGAGKLMRRKNRKASHCSLPCQTQLISNRKMPAPGEGGTQTVCPKAPSFLASLLLVLPRVVSWAGSELTKSWVGENGDSHFSGLSLSLMGVEAGEFSYKAMLVARVLKKKKPEA